MKIISAPSISEELELEGAINHFSQYGWCYVLEDRRIAHLRANGFRWYEVQRLYSCCKESRLLSCWTIFSAIILYIYKFTIRLFIECSWYIRSSASGAYLEILIKLQRVSNVIGLDLSSCSSHFAHCRNLIVPSL